MLRIIERATRQPIEPMALPTVEDVNQRRVVKFKARLAEALQSPALEAYRPVIEEFVTETDADIVDVAAALAGLAQGKQSLLLDKRKDEPAPAAPQRRTPAMNRASARLAAASVTTTNPRRRSG